MIIEVENCKESTKQNKKTTNSEFSKFIGYKTNT